MCYAGCWLGVATCGELGAGRAIYMWCRTFAEVARLPRLLSWTCVGGRGSRFLLLMKNVK